MADKKKYYEVREMPEDPWSSGHVFYTCDTLDDAERLMGIVKFQYPERDVFVAKYENVDKWPIFDLETKKKTGYWVTHKDGTLKKISLV